MDMQNETINYEDGKIYTGELKDDVPNGQGVLTDPNSGRYEGEWENDVPKQRL